jgi:hypothetical protein
MGISQLEVWLDDGFMGKSFRSYDLNQPLLLPASLDDSLPEDYLARLGVALLDFVNFSGIEGIRVS